MQDAPLVFVVDDEKIIADTLVAILRSSGFNADAFYNGRDAIRGAHERCPDILLSDVVMPQMDGFTLAHLMKHVCPSCRPVLFSGHAAACDYQAELKYADELQDIEILDEPMSPAALIAHLKSLIAESVG